MKLKLIDGTVDQLFYILQGWNWRIDNNLIIEIDGEIETEPRPEIPPDGRKVLVRDKASDPWDQRVSAGYFDAGWLVCYSLPEGGRNRLWKHWKYDEEVPAVKPEIPPNGTPVLVREDNLDWVMRYSSGQLDVDGDLLCYYEGEKDGHTLPWEEWEYLPKREVPPAGTKVHIRPNNLSSWCPAVSAGRLNAKGWLLCLPVEDDTEILEAWPEWRIEK